MITLKNFFTTDFNTREVVSLHKNRLHENFGFQWNKYSKLQLDSYNGSSESENRLLNQSELSKCDFSGKSVLEIGAGNGRFTEILLKSGAFVIAVDYSTAINANYKNHKAYVESGKLVCVQGDLFNLPLVESSFDFVICYGVIQHTGNNLLCMQQISRFVKPSGSLLLDIYSNSLRHFNPFIYAIRPIFTLIKGNERRMRIVEIFVNFIFPAQRYILTKTHNRKGLLKIIRYIINRSPNSVYGLNMHINGQISLEDAKAWSICDTNDAWTPKHDHPVSFARWKTMLKELARDNNFQIKLVKECGQGNCAVLIKE